MYELARRAWKAFVGFFYQPYDGPSVENIAERMIPVPEETLKLSRDFAHNVRLILEAEERAGTTSHKRAGIIPEYFADTMGLSVVRTSRRKDLPSRL